MLIQAADGRLHHLSGVNLPDEMSLYTGAPFHGAHLAEVLLSPKKAPGVPLLTNGNTRWIGKRDGCFLLFGMFSFWLIATLAEQTAHALAGM